MQQLRRRASRNYLNNADLTREIHRSKKTYCWFADPAFSDFHKIVDDVTEVTEPDIVYRIMDVTHVPLCDIPKLRSRSPTLKGRLRVNFPPFRHFILGQDGKPMEVGRSHWRGDLETGHFCQDHGRMTPALGRMFMLLVERYASRGNWRGYTYNDEMQGNALMQLSQVGLQFDESRAVTSGKPPNPFAFFTQVLKNVFRRTWNLEKVQSDIRDDIRQENGLMPSMARQLADQPSLH